MLPALARISTQGQIYDAGDASLVVKGGTLSYQIGESSTISLGTNNQFSLRQGGATSGLSDNILLYTPDQLDSFISSNEIKNSTILINDQAVWSLNSSSIPNAARITSSNQYTNGATVWDVTLKSKHIGTLRLQTSINPNNISVADNAGVQKIWIGGSTNSAQ